MVLSGMAPTRRMALIRASSFCISSEMRRTTARAVSGPAAAESDSTPVMKPSPMDSSPSSARPGIGLP